METLEELNQNFNLNELSNQLKSVIESRDPIGYMQSNLNWEIDNNVDEEQPLNSIAEMLTLGIKHSKSYLA